MQTVYQCVVAEKGNREKGPCSLPAVTPPSNPGIGVGGRRRGLHNAIIGDPRQGGDKQKRQRLLLCSILQALPALRCLLGLYRLRQIFLKWFFTAQHAVAVGPIRQGHRVGGWAVLIFYNLTLPNSLPKLWNLIGRPGDAVEEREEERAALFLYAL